MMIVMQDIDVAALGAALGEMGAGWWRGDVRDGTVQCSPNVPALLGLPPGVELTLDQLRLRRPWPAGHWRTWEVTAGGSASRLRTHLVAVRDRGGVLTAVFGLETIEHSIAADTPWIGEADMSADAQLLRDILAIQPALVARYLLDGTVVWCNEGYATHFLRTPAEVIGVSWVDLAAELGHETREHLDHTLATIVETTTSGTSAVVTAMIDPGPTRWIQWLNRRLPGPPGAPEVIQAVGVEVTELREARDALDAMAHELARGRMSERRELARRLHDDAIQVLVSAMWAISPSDGRDVPAQAAQRGVELVKEAIDHLRSCLSELTSPPVLPGLLVDALADDVDAVRAAGVDVHLDVDDAPREEVRAVAARVLGEGLRNVLRHAKATRVDVTLHVYDDEVVGTVVDDGVGASDDDVTRALASGHVGLLMSRALVESIGGTCVVRRNGAHGTVLQFRAPVQS